MLILVQAPGIEGDRLEPTSLCLKGITTDLDIFDQRLDG